MDTENGDRRVLSMMTANSTPEQLERARRYCQFIGLDFDTMTDVQFFQAASADLGIHVITRTRHFRDREVTEIYCNEDGFDYLFLMRSMAEKAIKKLEAEPYALARDERARPTYGVRRED